MDGLVERLRKEDQVTLGNIDEAEIEQFPEWTFGCIQDARKLLREAADALARMEGERHACDWDAMREIKEFEALYPDVRQLHQGFLENSPEGSWTEWDKSVADRFTQFGTKLIAFLATTPLPGGPAMNAMEKLACQLLYDLRQPVKLENRRTVSTGWLEAQATELVLSALNQAVQMERERNIRAVLDAGGDNADYHADAIRNLKEGKES